MKQKVYKSFITRKHHNLETVSVMGLKQMTSPITILFAPNGCGKTTTIKRMYEEAQKQGFITSYFSTSKDDAKNLVHPMSSSEDYLAGMQNVFKSEGEGISQSVGIWADKDLMPKLFENKKPMRIFVDEGDSGLSYDRIKHTLASLIFIVEMETKKFDRDLKVVMTGNSYEMLKAMESLYTQNIWLPTKEVWSPKTFEEFIEPYQQFYDGHLNNED